MLSLYARTFLYSGADLTKGLVHRNVVADFTVDAPVAFSALAGVPRPDSPGYLGAGASGRARPTGWKLFVVHPVRTRHKMIFLSLNDDDTRQSLQSILSVYFAHSQRFKQ